MASLTQNQTESNIDFKSVANNLITSPLGEDQINQNQNSIPNGKGIRIGDTILYNLNNRIIRIPINAFGDLDKYVNSANNADTEFKTRKALNEFDSPEKNNNIQFLSKGEFIEIENVNFSSFSLNNGYCDLAIIEIKNSKATSFVTYSTRSQSNMKHSGDRAKSFELNSMTKRYLCHNASIENLEENVIYVVAFYGYERKKLCEFSNCGFDPQVIIHSDDTNYLYTPDLSELNGNGNYIPVYYIQKLDRKIYAYVPKDPKLFLGKDTISNTSQFDGNQVFDILKIQEEFYLDLTLKLTQQSNEVGDIDEVEEETSKEVVLGAKNKVHIFQGIEVIEGLENTYRDVRKYFIPSNSSGPHCILQNGSSIAPYIDGQIRIYHISEDIESKSSFFDPKYKLNNCIFILYSDKDLKDIDHPVFLAASPWSICLIKKSNGTFTVARPFVGKNFGLIPEEIGSDYTQKISEYLLNSSEELSSIRENKFLLKQNVIFSNETFSINKFSDLVKNITDFSFMIENQQEIINVLKQLQYSLSDSEINEIKFKILEFITSQTKNNDLISQLKSKRKELAPLLLAEADVKEIKLEIDTLNLQIKTFSKNKRKAVEKLEKYVCNLISFVGVVSIKQLKERKNAAAELKRSKINSNVSKASNMTGQQIIESFLRNDEGSNLIIPLNNNTLKVIPDAMKLLNNGKLIGKFLESKFDSRNLVLDTLTTSAITEVNKSSGRSNPLSDRNMEQYEGLVTTVKASDMDSVTSLLVPISSWFSLGRTASYPWNKIADEDIAPYRIKIRALVRDYASSNGYQVNANDYSIGIVIILIFLEIAENFKSQIMKDKQPESLKHLSLIYDDLENLNKDPDSLQADIDEIIDDLESKITEPVKCLRVLLGVILTGCAAGNRGACNIWKMVWPDNVMRDKLSGIDYLIGIRTFNLFPFVDWNESYQTTKDNMRTEIGRFCWRVVESHITMFTKDQKKIQKKNQGKFLKSRNDELALLYVTKRVFFTINKLLKGKDINYGEIPSEYEKIFLILRSYYNEKMYEIINAKGGTNIIHTILNNKISWNSFQMGLVVLRNITVKRSGKFRKIKEKIVLSTDPEEFKSLINSLVGLCKSLAEKAMLFEEIAEKYCQNYKAFVEGDKDKMKSDGELGRVAWSIGPEYGQDLEALNTEVESILGFQLEVDSLKAPEGVDDSVVSNFYENKPLLEDGKQVVISQTDLIKSKVIQNLSDLPLSEKIVELVSSLNPMIAIKMVCQFYSLTELQLKMIFDFVEIENYGEVLCQGIMIALDTRDYESAISNIKDLLKSY